MALSLDQVNKGELAKTAKKKRQRAHKSVKPWGDSPTQPPKKPSKKARYKDISMSEVSELDDWFDQADQLFYKLQKNSYWLSRLTKTQEWVRSIEVYPKLKIPIPSLFSLSDKRFKEDDK